RIGSPASFRALTIFPLYSQESRPIEYLLADEAVAAGVVTVQEVSEAGSVPELSVENKGDTRVLFLEGEELRGARQNRILNTSVLVPARSILKIPVSCVEQRRWRYTSSSLSPSKSICSSTIRRTLKTSVSRSLKTNHSHHSDQQTIWNDVSITQSSLGI